MLKWFLALSGASRLQVTPVVVDGIMYVTGANECYALDAGNGRRLWHYRRPRTPGLVGDSSAGINRGVAVSGDRLFMVTDHAHLIALERFTGRLLWEGLAGGLSKHDLENAFEDGIDIGRTLSRETDTWQAGMKTDITPLLSVQLFASHQQDRFEFEPIRDAESWMGTATFRFAEPVFIDRQQNFRVEIEVPDADVLKELQQIYGPLYIWVVLDGYMTRDVQ